MSNSQVSKVYLLWDLYTDEMFQSGTVPLPEFGSCDLVDQRRQRPLTTILCVSDPPLNHPFYQ